MSLSIIAAIVFIIASASGWVRTYQAQQQIDNQCHLLEASLLTMVQSGASRDVDDLHAAEGAKRLQQFTLPNSLVFLCFGGNPDPSDHGSFSSALSDESSVICYKVQGGSTQVIWFPGESFQFREGLLVDSRWTLHDAGQSFILHHGGVYSLVFEHVEKNHESYILIHNTDDID